MHVNVLNKAQRLIFQNQFVRDYLVSLGVKPEICLISHGAVSEKIFFPSQNRPSTNYILISGEYKPRKNPELVRNVILANQNLPFILHGDGWDSFFAGALPRNLVLHPFDKLRQPKLVREASLLLSLSLNEGGPFPVLEALASGTPVVCTNTGFARELVSEDSGVVLSDSPSIHQISQAIRVGIALKQKNWSRNLLPIGHDWETFGRSLYLS
jgi:glycosyltransferase involved in cell wall biosynthesis